MKHRIGGIFAALLTAVMLAACATGEGDPASSTLPPEPTVAPTVPSEEEDPNAAVVIAGDFRIVDADKKEWVSDGDVVSAEAMLQVNEYDATYPVLKITLTEDGADKLEQATTEKLGQNLQVWVGEMLISTPQIVAPITDGSLMVTFPESRTEDFEEIERIAQAIMK